MLFSFGRFFMVAAVSLGLLGSWAQGAEKKAAPPDPKAADEIARLIAQLDSDQYSEREKAGERLSTLGKPAIEALTKAALDGSLEVTDRSIRLLSKFLGRSDEATKAAAKAALEKIAQSDRAAVVGRAKAALKADEPVVDSPMPHIMGGVINGGQIQFQIGIGGGNIGGGGLFVAVSKSVRVTNSNGSRQIDVHEDGKEIKISDSPQQGIKIEVTTKKNGKDVVQKYEAKNADELKKKQPEGYKLFQEYAENPIGAGTHAGMMIQGQGQGQIQLAPGPGLPQPLVPGAAPAQNAPAGGLNSRMPPDVQIKMATAQMKSLGRQLESLPKGDAWKNSSQESKDELQKQIQVLKRRLTKTQRELDK